MHCPNCGQQQVSNETKFCSRCGFQLGLVAELLAHGGFLPQLAQLYKKKTILTKKNGVVFSLFWFIFFTCFLTAFFGILGAPDELLGILAVTGFFGGLMFLIASLIFFRSSKEFVPTSLTGQPMPDIRGLYGQPSHTALPPQQPVPASIYSAPTAERWRDTNDLQPTSVTESTTRLLDTEEK